MSNASAEKPATTPGADPATRERTGRDLRLGYSYVCLGVEDTEAAVAELI
jgi:hypothetical protein